MDRDQFAKQLIEGAIQRGYTREEIAPRLQQALQDFDAKNQPAPSKPIQPQKNIVQQGLEAIGAGGIPHMGATAQDIGQRIGKGVTGMVGGQDLAEQWYPKSQTDALKTNGSYLQSDNPLKQGGMDLAGAMTYFPGLGQLLGVGKWAKVPSLMATGGARGTLSNISQEGFDNPGNMAKSAVFGSILEPLATYGSEAMGKIFRSPKNIAQGLMESESGKTVSSGSLNWPNKQEKIANELLQNTKGLTGRSTAKNIANEVMPKLNKQITEKINNVKTMIPVEEKLFPEMEKYLGKNVAGFRIQGRVPTNAAYKDALIQAKAIVKDFSTSKKFENNISLTALKKAEEKIGQMVNFTGPTTNEKEELLKGVYFYIRDLIGKQAPGTLPLLEKSHLLRMGSQSLGNVIGKTGSTFINPYNPVNTISNIFGLLDPIKMTSARALYGASKYTEPLAKVVEGPLKDTLENILLGGQNRLNK